MIFHKIQVLGLTITICNKITVSNMAVIKTQGPGISTGYYERDPHLLSWENWRKVEPKEIPSSLIPHLLVMLTRRLKILASDIPEVIKLHLQTTHHSSGG